MRKRDFYRPQTKFAKVVFTSICHFVHRGCAWQGGHVWQECVWGRGGMHGGERGMHGKGACVGSVHSGGGMYAKEMATVVGGKHPTGMHSCLCLPSVNVKAALHLRRTYC